ncbi:MAG: STY4534 family ICE replication protein [Candidatus Methylomirabilales bacterium]
MTDTTSDRNYFDLHILGIGYLHRVREITPKRGEPFLAVEVSALHGAAGQVEYTRFDCKVSGREAQRIVRQLMPDIRAEKRVLVGFKLSDLYAETFTYESGDKKGQTGVSLKARLLRIDWAKVEGEYVIRPKAREETQTRQGREHAAA